MRVIADVEGWRKYIDVDSEAVRRGWVTCDILPEQFVSLVPTTNRVTKPFITTIDLVLVGYNTTGIPIFKYRPHQQ